MDVTLLILLTLLVPARGRSQADSLCADFSSDVSGKDPIHLAVVLDRDVGPIGVRSHGFLFNQIACSLHEYANRAVVIDVWQFDYSEGACTVHKEGDISSKIFKAANHPDAFTSHRDVCSVLNLLKTCAAAYSNMTYTLQVVLGLMMHDTLEADSCNLKEILPVNFYLTVFWAGGSSLVHGIASAENVDYVIVDSIVDFTPKDDWKLNVESMRLLAVARQQNNAIISALYKRLYKMSQELTTVAPVQGWRRKNNRFLGHDVDPRETTTTIEDVLSTVEVQGSTVEVEEDLKEVDGDGNLTNQSVAFVGMVGDLGISSTLDPLTRPSTPSSKRPSTISPTSPSTPPSRSPSTSPSSPPSTPSSTSPSTSPSTPPSTSPSTPPSTRPSSISRTRPSTISSTLPSTPPSTRPSTGSASDSPIFSPKFSTPKKYPDYKIKNAGASGGLFAAPPEDDFDEKTASINEKIGHYFGDSKTGFAFIIFLTIVFLVILCGIGLCCYCIWPKYHHNESVRHKELKVIQPASVVSGSKSGEEKLKSKDRDKDKKEAKTDNSKKDEKVVLVKDIADVDMTVPQKPSTEPVPAAEPAKAAASKPDAPKADLIEPGTPALTPQNAPAAVVTQSAVEYPGDSYKVAPVQNAQTPAALTPVPSNASVVQKQEMKFGSQDPKVDAFQLPELGQGILAAKSPSSSRTSVKQDKKV